VDEFSKALDEKLNITNKIVKKYKCSNCNSCDHNKRKCPHKDKDLKKSKKENVDNYKTCNVCKNKCVSDLFIEIDGIENCYTCYKRYLENLKDKEMQRESTDETPNVSDTDSCDGIMSEDDNEYIYYEGIHYYYDRDTGVVAYNYEEIGNWNKETLKIEWNDEKWELEHKNSEYYKPN
jgi:hypothetical protein